MLESPEQRTAAVLILRTVCSLTQADSAHRGSWKCNIVSNKENTFHILQTYNYNSTIPRLAYSEENVSTD